LPVKKPFWVHHKCLKIQRSRGVSRKKKMSGEAR
jgi:hypothetical protein